METQSISSCRKMNYQKVNLFLKPGYGCQRFRVQSIGYQPQFEHRDTVVLPRIHRFFQKNLYSAQSSNKTLTKTLFPNVSMVS